MADTRFCPLHGDYEPDEGSTACPACKEDPLTSSASLQRVRVLTDRGPDPEGTKSPSTPVDEESPCPLCGALTALEDFRFESLGEEWTGKAAVWAEEGVCPGCYKQVLPPYLRRWSDAEWLAHHYEGWRTTLDQASRIVVYDDSIDDSWLPESQRHKILDVEKTLSFRREHLGRCKTVMEDLMARYPANLSPPPFEPRLAEARDQALSDSAIAQLKGLRDRHVLAQEERRHDSIVSHASDVHGPDLESRVKPEAARATRQSRLPGAIVLAVVGALLLLAAAAVAWVIVWD